MFMVCSELSTMYGIRLHVWGPYACFTRPEFKAERVSYELPTPSAARGILEAIYWKPGICWVVDRIHVLNPICFQSLRCNEVGSKIPVRIVRSAMRRGRVDGLSLNAQADRQQRSALILTDVAYVIEAHVETRSPPTVLQPVVRHLESFRRRARRGQCFHQPCLGLRPFAARFSLLEDSTPTPRPATPAESLGFGRERELGLMLWDLDHAADGKPSVMFRAILDRGVMTVPSPSSPELVR